MIDFDILVRFLVSSKVKYLIILGVFLLCRSLKFLFGSLILYTLLRFLYTFNLGYRCSGRSKWRSLHEFNDCKVVVTGGSKGLGRSIVEEFLTSFRNVTVLNVDVEQSPQPNERLIDYICDLGDSKMLEHTLSDIKANHIREIRLIVNNAGIRSSYEGFYNVKVQEARDILAVNSLAPLRFIQELTPRENNGEQCFVVNISSTLGILAPAKVAAYAASKAALIAFHKSYSFELESRGISNIRTLLVIPGQLDTTMFSGFEPPRQFFAPVLNKKKLAQGIIRRAEMGLRGDYNTPLYANFAYLMMAMPYSVQCIARSLSKMDNCLPSND